MTLEEIVSDYIRKYSDDARAEMRFFEIQRSPFRWISYSVADGSSNSNCNLPPAMRSFLLDFSTICAAHPRSEQFDIS
jgi:hypothetical protein